MGYTITVTAGGFGTSENVTISDTLPGGYTWSVTPPVAGCGIVGNVLTCNAGNMSSGAIVLGHGHGANARRAVQRRRQHRDGQRLEHRWEP